MIIIMVVKLFVLPIFINFANTCFSAVSSIHITTVHFMREYKRELQVNSVLRYMKAGSVIYSVKWITDCGLTLKQPIIHAMLIVTTVLKRCLVYVNCMYHLIVWRFLSMAVICEHLQSFRREDCWDRIPWTNWEDNSRHTWRCSFHMHIRWGIEVERTQQKNNIHPGHSAAEWSLCTLQQVWMNSEFKC